MFIIPNNGIKFIANKLLVKPLILYFFIAFDLVEAIDNLLIWFLLGNPEEVLIKLCEFLEYGL